MKNIETSKRTQRGFTIVELLIVVVVIAILAGITIVAYAGITSTAQQSKIAQTVLNVISVAEAFNADKGYYPALALTGTDALATYSGSTRIPTGINIVKDVGTPPATTAITAASTPSSGAPTISFACFPACATTTATGGRLTYWDPKTATQKSVYVGAATSASSFVYPAT